MNALEPSTLLQRISKIDIELTAGNAVQLKWGLNQLDAGIHALTILNIFRQPTTLSTGVQLVSQIENADESAINIAIEQLFDAGILESVDVLRFEDTSSGDFGNPRIHIAMLNDRVRTESYLKAIHEVVQPGDVVIDLGTGTGVLAMAAAQAGAAKVYAIEANRQIAAIAQANFDRNGFGDRIILCKGRSIDITLPERADVLVSEIIGDDPFDEQIIEITEDARQRFLKPDARMIPGRIAVFGLPVTIPKEKYAGSVFSMDTIDQWHAWYKLDFSALSEIPFPHDAPIFNVSPQHARDWHRLSEPLRFANVDLHQYLDQRVDYEETIIAQAAGLLNGLLIYFEVELSPQTLLSTHPDIADKENHWLSPVWGAFPPIDVQIGDQFAVQYEADSQRNWTFASVFSRDNPILGRNPAKANAELIARHSKLYQ